LIGEAIKSLFTGEEKHGHHDKHSKHVSKTEVHEEVINKPQMATATTGAARTTTATNVNCDFGAEKEILEAQRLKQEACRTLQSSEATAQAARLAQAEVEQAAARANTVTNAALRQEVQGQKTLVEAGQKLMEAGAKLQQEAAETDATSGAALTYVQKGAVNQKTHVEASAVPQAEMHVQQKRVTTESRPVVETAVHTERIDVKSKGAATATAHARTAEIH